MSDKQRRDYGSGSVSQRKDGTWTARMVIGTNETGKPKVKAFYGKTEREVKKKLKEFEKELHKNDGAVVQKKTVETYMLDWLYSVKANELKPKSFDRLEQTLVNQVIPSIGHLQVAALTADDVQKMINDLKAEGLGHSTIKKAYDAVNACFKTGIIKKQLSIIQHKGSQHLARNLSPRRAYNAIRKKRLTGCVKPPQLVTQMAREFTG